MRIIDSYLSQGPKRAMVYSVLVLLSLLAFTFAWSLRQVNTPLLTGSASKFPWKPELGAIPLGQGTYAKLLEQDPHVAFEFSLDKVNTYPHAAYNLNFYTSEHPKWLDLSGFSEIAFDIQCSPSYLMKLEVFTHDPQVSVPGDDRTYRIADTYFACKDGWQRITNDLKSLVTAIWWLDKHHIDRTERAFPMNAVYKLSIGSAQTDRRDTPVVVRIKDLSLIQQRHWPLVMAGLFTLLIWLTVLVRQFKVFARNVSKSQTVSVQIETGTVEGKVLHYLSKNFTQADLSLQTISEALNLTRQEVSQIIKAELGVSLASYVNKLRVIEGARILREVEGVSVSEIAYSLGFNSASYFNKVFKDEYGCAPSGYKDRFSIEAERSTE